MHLTALLLTQLVILCHGKAWAHAGAIPETIDINGPFANEKMGLETTMGYMRGVPGGAFEWLCHETVTTPEAVVTPRYTESADGILLAHVSDPAQARSATHSLYRTEDGCTWTEVSDVAGHTIADVAFDPEDPDHVLAITANKDGPNFLYRSRDAGLRWERDAIRLENRIFRSVLFSKKTNAVWMTAVRFDTNEGWVFHSEDNGAHWVEHPVDLPEADEMNVYLDVLIADGEDPNRAWFVAGPYLDDDLMETRDGGETFTVVYAPDGDIIDGAQDADDALWIVASGGSLIFSENGDFFERLEHAPGSMGVTTSAEQVYLAHRLATESTAISTTSDGQGFERIDVFSHVEGPPMCPLESDSATECDPLWTQLQPPEEDTASELHAQDTPPPSAENVPHNNAGAPTAGGCCANSDGSTSMAILLLVPAWMRMRELLPKQKRPMEPMGRQ